MRRLLVLVSAVAFSSVTIAAQDSRVPRTEWGDPDLEGTWLSLNDEGFPFQRPLNAMDDAELLRELVDSGALELGLIGEGVPQAARIEHRRLELANWRSTHFAWGSLVVEPSDGRIPPLVASARDRAAAAWRSSVLTEGPWDSASSLGPVERCISRGVLRSMLPAFDYHGLRIFQAPGVVAITAEAIHETRVVPLDDRAPLSSAIRGYIGDARGFWDGDTLVVETTGFNGKTGAHLNGNETPMSERLRLVERFTRNDDGHIEYEVTVDDPDTWTAPWKVSSRLKRDDGYAFSEYACHEGNYALPNILSAARAAERR